MRILLSIALSASLLVACGKTEPASPPAPVAAAPADVAPEPPPLTPEEQLAERIKARENAPEPELNPDEPREQFQLVWVKGKDALRSAQEARYNLFLQMKSQKLTEKDHIALFEKMMKVVEDFGIGQSRDELEKAPADVCTAVKALRDGAKVLTDGPTAELAKLDEEIKALEKAQEEGKTVFQSKWNKVEESRKTLSQPILAGRFLLLAARQILDEALVIAEWGPRRAQLALRDCAQGLVDDGGLALDLAQASLEKLLARAKWYRELE